VLRCLAKSPADRFASMAELASALGELAALPEAASQATETPPRTVPLGRGFRSVYDANVRAALGKSALFTGAVPGLAGLPATHPLRAKLQFSPPPEALSDDTSEAVGESRGRAAVRAALACVLVVGVTLGLVFALMLGDSTGRPAARAAPVALPVESATPLEHDRPPGDRVAPGPEPVEEADREPRRTDPDPGARAAQPDAPRAAAIAAAAAPRPRVSSEQRAAKAMASRTSRPSSGSSSSVRSSRPAPSAPPARTSAPSAGPAAPPPAPPAAPASTLAVPQLVAPPPAPPAAPTTEDLYDGR